MTYQEIISKVSEDLNLPEEVVDTAYKSYWKFIRETVKVLPLKNVESEEEFTKLRTSFNIPSLGKLYCSYDKILGAKRRIKYLKENKWKIIK